mgnify:CR=1 FL=1
MTSSPFRIPALHQYVDIGTRAGAPMRIFAQCTSLSFAGMIVHLVMAGTIKRQFENAHLTVYARDNRPHVRDLIAMAPWINGLVLIPGDKGAIPLDIFEGDYWTKGEPQSQYASGPIWTDMHISSSMAHDLRIHALPNHARLRVPMDECYDSACKFDQSGLIVSGAPFICIHYRDATYPGSKPSPHRDQDVATWAKV